MMRSPYLYGRLFILVLGCFTLNHVSAQTKILKGIIKDEHSDERIPFASIRFQKSGAGKLADSAGAFTFRFEHWPSDTLEITYVGYKDFKIFIDPSIATGDTIHVVANMDRGKYQAEVIVKRKIDRGLLMWRRIVKHKPINDRYRFNNFSYELYNKLELDLKNVNKDKLGEMKLLRPFKFILENVDTTEGTPFLPVPVPVFVYFVYALFLFFLAQAST